MILIDGGSFPENFVDRNKTKAKQKKTFQVFITKISLRKKTRRRRLQKIESKRMSRACNKLGGCVFVEAESAELQNLEILILDITP
jgi:hypothetical protein